VIVCAPIKLYFTYAFVSPVVAVNNSNWKPVDLSLLELQAGLEEKGERVKTNLPLSVSFSLALEVEMFHLSINCLIPGCIHFYSLSHPLILCFLSLFAT